MNDTVDQVLNGDQRTLSRLISLLEKRDPKVNQVMEALFSHTGKAYCIGVTGLPGSGKSTLVDRLTEVMRREGLSIGIIAIDPTSPYSNGAFLGDRIRMQRHSLDSGVFIRSMATRDGYGGLPRTINETVRVLDASGKDVIIVETVGVGQTELRIMGAVDTVIVTLVPESGDVIQTLKAGLMEIGDIYVVNKADRQGARKMTTAITSMLKMDSSERDWTPPVVATQARIGKGIDALHERIMQHRSFLESDSGLQRRRGERRIKEFLDTIEEELNLRIKQFIKDDGRWSSILDDVEKGVREPHVAALKVVEEEFSLAGPLTPLTR